MGLATAEYRLGRWTAAQDLLRRAPASGQEHVYRLVTGHARTVLAQLGLGRGRPAEAHAAAERALTIQRETGHRITDADPGPVLIRLGKLGEPARHPHVTAYSP